MILGLTFLRIQDHELMSEVDDDIFVNFELGFSLLELGCLANSNGVFRRCGSSSVVSFEDRVGSNAGFDSVVRFIGLVALSPARDAFKSFIPDVGFICPFVVIDPTD
jgi:hypothetical protein